MRPTKAHSLVRLAIAKTLKDRNVQHIINVKPAINKLIDKCVANGDDCQRYYDDTHINNLLYISDRFNCSGRLRWLLYIADKGVTGEL